jgi:hypothetical protein
MDQRLNKSPEFVEAREKRLRRLMSTQWAARNAANAREFWADPSRQSPNVVRYRNPSMLMVAA